MGKLVEEASIAKYGHEEASLMVREGALTNPAPEAIFGLHVRPNEEVGVLSWRAGGLMASTDLATALAQSDRLFDEIMAYDVRALGPRWEVPFFVLQGESDVITLTTLARQYYEELEAPAVMRRNRRETVAAMQQSGVEMLDIPAFLRRGGQAKDG